MVNVGGPSKGCRTCIQRKIRCDRQRPSCGQCRKSHRQCLGYRDELDLMFRNHSHAVVRTQSRDQSSPKHISRRPLLGDGLSSTFKLHDGQTLDKSAPVMVRSPKLEKQNTLIMFFANNYTYNTFNLGSSMFWVPAKFTDLLNYNCTRLSVHAAGAMSLARLRNSPSCFREGQRCYGDALLSLARLWQQTGIDQDAILLTVQFLGLFEVLAAFDSSRRSWVTHLQGLGNLLHQGPKDGVRTELGARMLLQSRSQAVVNALQTKTAVPNIYRQPDQRVPPSMHSHVFHSDLADVLLIRLATFQAQSHSSGPSPELLADLYALDNEFYRWTQNVTHHWHFTKQSSNGISEGWWDVRHDTYPTAITAHVWNKVRAARILIFDLVQGRLPTLWDQDDCVASQILTDARRSNLQELVTNVCATIPPYWRPSSLSQKTAEDVPPLGTAFFFLWPLEIIGSMNFAGAWPGFIDWILRTLKRIHATMGTMNALRLAKKIKIIQGIPS